jgi:NAD(P)H dehydrogenase (quinone)
LQFRWFSQKEGKEKMNVLIVYAHPEPKSFNSTLANTAKAALQEAGHTVVVSDLYAMNWQPVSDRRNFSSVAEPDYFKQQVEEQWATANRGYVDDIQAEQEKIKQADLVIFQFPMWWGGTPAILKGWFDRVFTLGVTYGYGQWYDEGLLKGKRAMLSVTTGGPESMYALDGLNGDIDALLKPIQYNILRFVGFDVLPPFISWAPASIDEDARKTLLGDYTARLASLDKCQPIQYPHLREYDPATMRLAGKSDTAAASAKKDAMSA